MITWHDLSRSCLSRLWGQGSRISDSEGQIFTTEIGPQHLTELLLTDLTTHSHGSCPVHCIRLTLLRTSADLPGEGQLLGCWFWKSRTQTLDNSSQASLDVGFLKSSEPWCTWWSVIWLYHSLPRLQSGLSMFNLWLSVATRLIFSLVFPLPRPTQCAFDTASPSLTWRSRTIRAEVLKDEWSSLQFWLADVFSILFRITYGANMKSTFRTKVCFVLFLFLLWSQFLNFGYSV